MQFTIVPYVEGEKVPVCPDTVQSSLFHYCYYADNGEYEVTMSGRLITNALNTTNSSYWVTAMDGVRIQRNATSEQVTEAYDMTWHVDDSGQHNNRLYQSQPYIDSYLGLSLNLAVNDVNNSHGGQRELSLLGSPPREYWPPVVNDTLLASTAPVHSYFVYQLGSEPNCPMRAERAGLLQQWSFQYVIRSPNMAWAITCSGSLTVLGPYQQSSAPSRSMYVVVGASGIRTYTDDAGADHVSDIVGLANATSVSASQLLYNTSASFAPDSLGVALLLGDAADFPGQAQSTLLRLSSADGSTIYEMPCYPAYNVNSTAPAAASTAAQYAVSLSVDTGSPTWTQGSFTVNGDTVHFQYGSGGIWVMAVILPLLAMHAVFAVQRIALKLQSRVSQSHPFQVSGAVWTASVVYGICGVWAAELLLASTLTLDCPDCIYEYELQLRQSHVLLALLPALLLSVPSWYLLSNAAAIVRIRKSVRVSDLLLSRRKDNQIITSGTATSAASTGSIARTKTAIVNTADGLIDRIADALVMLRSNLCAITFVIGLPLTAAMVLTRITLEYGLVGPVDVTPRAPSNVLCSVLDSLLLWLLVAMHLSGLTWRCLASVGLPLVILFDFYVGSLSRSVTWDTGSSSLSAASLSMID